MGNVGKVVGAGNAVILENGDLLLGFVQSDATSAVRKMQTSVRDHNSLPTSYPMSSW